MIFNVSEYALTENNFIAIETLKKHIVIGHTFNEDMRHTIGWLSRFNGKYKKTAAFTISSNGIIYKHFDPKYYSNFFNNTEQNKKSIVVLLENTGYLIPEPEKNQFITSNGNIYNKNEGIVEKKWRDYSYWSTYKEYQYESTIKLVRFLCEEFSIPLTVVEHNTKIDNVMDYTGVLYKSNLNKNYTDLSPSWDFKRFKEELEIKNT